MYTLFSLRGCHSASSEGYTQETTWNMRAHNGSRVAGYIVHPFLPFELWHTQIIFDPGELLSAYTKGAPKHSELYQRAGRGRDRSVIKKKKKEKKNCLTAYTYVIATFLAV